MASALYGQTQSEANSTNLPMQKIGANDLVMLSVYGAPEMQRTVRVNSEGMIRLPMLKQPVKAIGLLQELEKRIAVALVNEEILVEPLVTVNVVEYHSRPISVAGAVRRPTTFQAIGEVSLLDAITRAEGLAESAGTEILVTRKQMGPDGQMVSLIQRIPVKGLIDTADPEFNVVLVGGEEIRVPEAGKVFIAGNVKKPGAYLVGDASDTTVMKVLALSEGLAPFASKQAYIYRRDPVTGAKNEIPVELNQILQRKSSDVALMASDILYVPDNRSKRVGLSALERILTFGAATGSGLLIYGTVR
jgi:polysaccharide export outer membrane protein